MATELQDTLTRIIAKSKVMIEKYHVLETRKQQLDAELLQEKSDNEKLRTEIERLKRENEYLRLAHTIAPTPEAVAKSRGLVSKLVRDIDKCIKQLNA